MNRPLLSMSLALAMSVVATAQAADASVPPSPSATPGKSSLGYFGAFGPDPDGPDIILINGPTVKTKRLRALETQAAAQ